MVRKSSAMKTNNRVALTRDLFSFFLLMSEKMGFGFFVGWWSAMCSGFCSWFFFRMGNRDSDSCVLI